MDGALDEGVIKLWIEIKVKQIHTQIQIHLDSSCLSGSSFHLEPFKYISTYIFTCRGRVCIYSLILFVCISESRAGGEPFTLFAREPCL